jgi:hypothetical protein
MREIKTTDGVPMSVQVDFAVRAWLQARGVRLATEPKGRTARNVSRSHGDDRGAALR